MKADPILEEIWSIKDKLSREMSNHPADYRAKLNAIVETEANAGRKVIRSAEELRRWAVERERENPCNMAWLLNDSPRDNKE